MKSEGIRKEWKRADQEASPQSGIWGSTGTQRRKNGKKDGGDIGQLNPRGLKTARVRRTRPGNRSEIAAGDTRMKEASLDTLRHARRAW